MSGHLNQTNAQINHIFHETNAAYHDFAVKFGISDSVFAIMYVISSIGEPCLLSDIVKYSGTSKQTINSALRKMEENGLILLEDYNGRKKQLTLTEKGKSLVSHTVEKAILIENQIFDGWSKEEQETFVRLNQRYLNELKSKISELENYGG
ncbi:MAG: MarR family transcriptional regulator [Peptococcaceae bacterium]|nr:MarR family transcriptional regulator [Peptococcaceae bacterium]